MLGELVVSISLKSKGTHDKKTQHCIFSDV